MDSDEALWQEPNVDPSFEAAPPHDLYASIYTSTLTQGNLYIFCVSVCILTETKIRVYFKKS